MKAGVPGPVVALGTRDLEITTFNPGTGFKRA